MTSENKKILYKSIKIAISTILFILTAYFLYGTIGSLILWFFQPRFVSATTTTASMGFIVQMIVFGSLFLIGLSLSILSLYLFFFRKKNKEHFAHTDKTKWV